MLTEAPGTIALPTSEVGRFALFTIALASTIQPPNTCLQVTASASVTENVNQVMRQLRDEDEWCWIMGDDHCWPRDTLMVMLQEMDENPEVDILVPLVVRRNPPWAIGLFHEIGTKDAKGNALFMTYTYEEIPEEGIFEIDAAGSAGMLIRRRVIDMIPDPWFYSTMDNEGRQVVLNEDVTFCTRARHDYGLKIHATTRATLGHLGIFNVRPLRREGRWGALTEFSSAEEQFRSLFMPVETAHAH